MSVLTVRVDDDIRGELESLARSRHTTVSGLLRERIDDLLGREASRAAPVDPPMHLSLVERRVLAQQHRILALLDPEDPKYHRSQEEVLTSGYTAEYLDGFNEYEEELPQARCELVWDILDMFTVLEASLSAHSAEVPAGFDEDLRRALTFGGFDANDRLEVRLLRYARYLIQTDRWTNLADRFDGAHDHGNSHAALLSTYVRMLGRFEPIWERKMTSGDLRPESMRLSVEELESVARARSLP